MPGLRMPDDIVEEFLDDAVQGELLFRMERDEICTDFERWLDAILDEEV